MDWSLPASSVHEFPRQEYWIELPFPPLEDLADHVSCISCISRWILYHWNQYTDIHFQGWWTLATQCRCLFIPRILVGLVNEQPQHRNVLSGSRWINLFLHINQNPCILPDFGDRGIQAYSHTIPTTNKQRELRQSYTTSWNSVASVIRWAQ